MCINVTWGEFEPSYSNTCCVFWPAFGCSVHPKAGRNTLKKVWNEQKSLKTAEKKCFDQLSGVRSTQKLIEIQNNCATAIENNLQLKFGPRPALFKRLKKRPEARWFFVKFFWKRETANLQAGSTKLTRNKQLGSFPVSHKLFSQRQKFIFFNFYRADEAHYRSRFML